MNSRLVVTHHAVDRYRERYRPDATFEAAWTELEARAANASPRRQKTAGGERLWATADDPPLILVTKPDAGQIVVVTVLPPGAMAAVDAIDQPVPVDGLKNELANLEHALEHATSLEKLAAKSLQVHEKARRVACDVRQWLSTLQEFRDVVRNEVAALASSGSTAFKTKIKNQEQKITALEQKLAKMIPAGSLEPHKSRIASLEKQLARQVEHGKRMSEDRNAARRLLLISLMPLSRHTDEADVAAAMRAILRDDPGALERSIHAWAERAPWFTALLN